MDPVSAMAAASTAFATIKKGFAVGRDVESMMSDIGRWMGALSDLDQAEKEAKNPPIFKKLFAGKSVEQEAMEVFSAKRKAQAQRNELKQWVGLTLGQSAWEDLVRTEAKIRKQRQETLYAQRERRRKFVEIMAWLVMAGAGAAVLVSFVMLLKAHTAKAEDLYVTCRLAGYEKINGEWVCLYRGTNNTQDVIHLNDEGFCPRQISCKYEPNKKTRTIKDAIDSIKEAMQ
jgi:hypothetical protein